MKLKSIFKTLLSICLICCLVGGCASTANKDTPKTTDPATDAATEGTVAEKTTEGSTESSENKLKIGVVYYSLTDTLGTEVVRLLDQFGGWYGVEMQYVQASSTEDVIAAVENLCAAGCDGIISCFVNSSLVQILNICDNYGVYYGAIQREIPDEETRQAVEAIDAYSWYVGGVHEDEYDAGYTVVSTLAEQGTTKIGLVGAAQGISSAHDERYEGFLAACEDLRIEIASEARVASVPERTEAVQSMLATYSDLSGIAVSGSGMDSVMQVIDSAGKSNEVLLGTIDIGEGAATALEENKIQCLLGGHAIDAVFSAANMYNAITGHSQGEVNLLLHYINIDSLETYERYMALCEGENSGVTKEELDQFIFEINPEASYEDFAEFVFKYSLDDIEVRHAK